MTFHHIVPKHLGGPNSRDNGSIINSVIHPLIHIIEKYDEFMFENISESLQSINEQACYPDYYQLLSLQNTFQFFIKLYNKYLTVSELRIAYECSKILFLEQEHLISEQNCYCREMIKKI